MNPAVFESKHFWDTYICQDTKRRCKDNKMCRRLLSCATVPRSTSPSCAFRLRMLPGAVNYVLLAENFSYFPRYNMSNYGRRAFCFAGLRLELTFWAYPAININSCLQAFTKDISTPADIAPSALETIIFYCSVHSLITYYLLLLQKWRLRA